MFVQGSRSKHLPPPGQRDQSWRHCCRHSGCCMLCHSLVLPSLPHLQKEQVSRILGLVVCSLMPDVRMQGWRAPNNDKQVWQVNKDQQQHCKSYINAASATYTSCRTQGRCRQHPRL